jgi:hypothetical protein
VERDERIYSQLGEVIKDEDICAEVIAHHLIASIQNDGKGGTRNHPRIDSDAPASFSDVFLSCLTTDGFLTTTSAPEAIEIPKGQKTVKCITRTNDSFLMETHAMLSQIEQEIQAWSMLDTLLPRKEGRRGADLDDTSSYCMSWKHEGTSSLHESDLDLSLCGMFPEGLAEFSETDPTALLEYAIEFERCKIENILKMCYSFSRGKRNQFISRNIREVAFCYFLNPGEPEFLLQVCGLKNSSIVPSIIVSRLRQNDVDRLAKIIDEMTVYSVIEEFAEFNDLNIREKNIASHNHAKYLFYSRCYPSTANEAEESPSPTEPPTGPTVPTVPTVHRVTPTEIHSLIQHLSQVSIGTALDAHLTQTLGSHAFIGEGEPSGESGEGEDEDEDGANYSIFPSRSALRRMYKHESSYRFLSPDVSVPWQSPRGLVRVIRVILFRCINFFMKEISHLIDVRSFFFNSWMTVRLCNDPTFIKLYRMRENIVLQTQRDQSEHDESRSSEEVPEVQETSEVPEEELRVPTREEIASLFSSTAEEEEEEEASEEMEEEEEAEPEEETIFSFSPEFTTVMRARAEDFCMNFYFKCPVVLQCMTGCFLWNPSTCKTKECLGSDSLLGIHTWLCEMTKHISTSLIPELLVQNAFYLESGKAQTWTMPRNRRRRFPLGEMGDVEVETLAILFSSTRDTYEDSTYPDKGMHYKHLLMLLSNMPSFGNHGVYSTMVEHLCIFVIQMNVMLFPHILETFSIHIQGEPTASTGAEEMAEESPPLGGAFPGKQKSVPIDPTIHYVEHFGEGEDGEEEFESVSMYYPKTST